MSKCSAPAAAVSPCDGVSTSHHTVIAVADYELPGKGFLRLCANDLIHIVEADASGWWLGVNTAGHKGVLPSTYTLLYHFPVPQKDLAQELELMRLSQSYGLDLCSGVPVAAVDGLSAATLHTGGLAESSTPRSTDELYKAIDAAILDRESRRKTVGHALKRQLAHSSTSKSDASTTAPSCTNSIDVLAARAISARNELTCSLRAAVAEKDGRISGAPDMGGAAADSFPQLPSRGWYAQCRLETALCRTPDAEGFFSEAAELRDAKAAVQCSEAALTRLSGTIKAEEAQYREAKVSLAARITSRDAAVTELLGWWTAKAESARASYLSVKAQRLRDAEVHQQQIEAMRHTLAVKRHRFTRLSEELEDSRAAAREVKDQLQHRETLEHLEEQVQQMTTRISKLQRTEQRSRRDEPSRRSVATLPQ